MPLDRLAVVRRRIHEQGLAGEGFATPADAVAHLGAVQAQEFAEVLWSLAERVPGATVADVEESFARGEILRTHVLRPTWHFVVPADIRWMLALTAPRVHQFNRYWYRQAGLDEEVIARSQEVIAATMADGEPRIRRQLGEALGAAGIEDATGVRLAHLMMYAELEGLVASGPRRGKQQTYALLPGQAPELSDDEALAELTRRYFVSHGPATVKDFSWWSGLTMGQVREGLALVDDELASEEDEDGTPWYSAPTAARGTGPTGCHLIPMYDELGVAYKDLRMMLREQPPAEGKLERPILIDGECVGSWRRTTTGKRMTLTATLFTDLSGAERSALEAASERFGADLELVAALGSPAKKSSAG